MKSLFFDATYIVKLHWREPGSAEVLAEALTADEIVCSLHGRAEFYSVGLRKFREGHATPAGIAAVFSQFNADITSGDIRLLPLTDAILDRVESIFATPATTYSTPPMPSSWPRQPKMASRKFTPMTNTASPPPRFLGCVG